MKIYTKINDSKAKATETSIVTVDDVQIPLTSETVVDINDFVAKKKTDQATLNSDQADLDNYLATFNPQTQIKKDRIAADKEKVAADQALIDELLAIGLVLPE